MPVLGRGGNLFRILRDPVAQLPRLRQQYGDLVAVSANDPGVVCVFGPKNNQTILADAKTFHTVDAGILPVPPDSSLSRLLRGIVSMNVPKHSQHRRMLNPAFHPRALDGYFPQMVFSTQTLLSTWKIGQTVDLWAEMKRFTIDVALRTLFGLDVATEAQSLTQALNRWIDLLSAAMFFRVALPGTPLWRLLRLSTDLEERFRRFIETKRLAGTPGSDVLSILVRARDEDGTKLTDEELLGHAYILFLAGHHTTSAALTWTLFLLERHPEIMSQVREEASALLKGDMLDPERQDQLPLLDAVINESLRLFPPGTFQFRVARSPFSVGGVDLPAEARLIYSSYVTHRDPDIFPDPYHFKPDRWRGFSPSPFEYLPFAAGPRKCIGATFAIQEMRIILSAIVQRFDLVFPNDRPVMRAAVPALHPRGGLRVQLAPQGRTGVLNPVRGNINEMVVL